MYTSLVEYRSGRLVRHFQSSRIILEFDNPMNKQSIQLNYYHYQVCAEQKDPAYLHASPDKILQLVKIVNIYREVA